MTDNPSPTDSTDNERQELVYALTTTDWLTRETIAKHMGKDRLTDLYVRTLEVMVDDGAVEKDKLGDNYIYRLIHL